MRLSTCLDGSPILWVTGLEWTLWTYHEMLGSTSPDKEIPLEKNNLPHMSLPFLWQDELITRETVNEHKCATLGSAAPLGQHKISLYNKDSDQGWFTNWYMSPDTNGFIMDSEVNDPEGKWMVAASGTMCNVYNHMHNPASKMPDPKGAEKFQFCTNPEHAYLPFYQFNTLAEPACDDNTPNKTPVAGWPTNSVPLARSIAKLSCNICQPFL